jgi:large subunit ribosomal protein L18
MISKKSKNSLRALRQARVRKTVNGSAEQPRLSVFRSLKNMYAQIIDDESGKTLLSASSLEKEVKAELAKVSMTERAKRVGEMIGKRAKDKGIETVVFDRAGYKYHGRIAALADGARSAGLQF